MDARGLGQVFITQMQELKKEDTAPLESCHKGVCTDETLFCVPAREWQTHKKMSTEENPLEGMWLLAPTEIWCKDQGYQTLGTSTFLLGNLIMSSHSFSRLL